MTTVRTAAELAAAIDAGEQQIIVDGVITGSPRITLPPGTTLSGGTLRFGAKGVRLTRDNTLKDVTIETATTEAAILNDTRVTDAGTLRLENVTTTGAVALLAEENVTSMRVEVKGLHVRDADVRSRIHRPHGFGVDVLQGGFTLWNRQSDPSVVVTATLEGIAIGTSATPVRGSGVFVAGHGDEDAHADGGILKVDLLHTEAVVTDGGIQPGTADLISAGVFVVSGARVDQVVNAGPVTTHGQNDMVLDNWGVVKNWRAQGPIISTGPSGIGFVNFGDIEELTVDAPIVTVGRGARGFNLYDGSLKKAVFRDIRTHGDGSIGVQISKPMGTLHVLGDVATTGGVGMSLVKGKQMELAATAMSIKDGAVVDSIEIDGALVTDGNDLTTYEVNEGGKVGSFTCRGGVQARGTHSTTTDIKGEHPAIG